MRTPDAQRPPAGEPRGEQNDLVGSRSTRPSVPRGPRIVDDATIRELRALARYSPTARHALICAQRRVVRLSLADPSRAVEQLADALGSRQAAYRWLAAALAAAER